MYDNLPNDGLHDLEDLKKRRREDGFVTTLVTAVGITLFVHHLFPELDILVTLAVDIIVGILLAGFIYQYSRTHEKKIETVLAEISKVVNEQEKARRQKKLGQQRDLYDMCQDLQKCLLQTQSNAKKYGNDCTGQDEIKQHAEKLDTKRGDMHEFLDGKINEKLKTILASCISVDTRTIQPLLDQLQSIIDYLAESLNIMPKDEPKSKVVEVETDRPVYPPNGIVHVSIKINSIAESRVIFCEIFDSNNDRITSQTLTPTLSDHPHENVFHADFQVKGKGWKTRSRYVVKATHGSNYAEATFKIDQRTPILELDKSVYMAGSDMFITVIDPDANLDSHVAEYAGDRDGSKLVIESPYGKISSYRLQETGKSTGIFQGLVGILRVRGDGSVVPQEHDGKTINTIRGTGSEDGFIGGASGDKLTARYTNNLETAELEFYMSDFAVVELDKKTYRLHDIAHMTIIAPELSSNYGEVNEMVQSPVCIVNIRTKKDMLQGYKLIETGPNTGVFAGEIKLADAYTGANSGGTGPDDGVILCSHDDLLEISFAVHGEEFVSRAEIRDG